ncbi:hypothetical protein CEXT_46521 [Caerostris extrusa]|uniref:Uncharacterized protein n=1 Tax=Caerostris extrusa TaxID=172846 RepID=A0AAV4MR24_CAEEX|nr:hypothetical protein CEXT_46521 [Caerostris extrusa]
MTPRPPNRKKSKKKKTSPGISRKLVFAATDAVPKGFSGSSKESRLQGNQTFLAKPDATASEPEKEKKKYRQGSTETRFLRPQMPFQRILGLRYEVWHLGF